MLQWLWTEEFFKAVINQLTVVLQIRC